MSVKPELAFDVCWEGGARWAGLGFAHGAVSSVLPGSRPLRKCAAFPRLERARLGELVGGDPPPLRKRTLAPRHVSAAEILSWGRVDIPAKVRLSALRPALQKKGVAEAEEFAGFGAGDAGVGGEAVEVVEAAGGRPGRELRAAKIAESFLETVQGRARL